MRVRGVAGLATILLALQAVSLPVVAQNQTECPEGACPPDGLPDLTVSGLHADPAVASAGQVVWIRTDLRNDGAVEATFDVAFLVDGQEVARFPGNHLPPGGSLQLEKDWSAAPGAHTVEVLVDPENVVAESDEGDNRLSSGIDVADGGSTGGSVSGSTDGVWRECRDGREWEVHQNPDGTRSEQDVGPCGGSGGGGGGWVVSEWCDPSGQRQVEYQYEDGRREVRPEGACDAQAGGGGAGDPYGQPPQPEPYQDPYGCDAGSGQWWDHYLARCVSEAEWQLQDGLFRCTEEAHRSLAQDQMARDIEERERRQERRAMETKAMNLEREGRYDEARAVWDELRRLDWEDQKRFHETEQQIADRVNACVDEFSQKASANGWDYLVEEFEMQRFHAVPRPMPPSGPGPGGPSPGGFECPPPGGFGGPGEYPAGDRPAPGGAYPDGDPYGDPHIARDQEPYGGQPYGDPYGDPQGDPYGEPRGGGPGPGGPCGGPGGPGGPGHGPDFGLPPEAVAAMEEARAWCEEQRWEVESLMFGAESYEAAQEAEDRMRDVERQCRERMEAIFREYDRGYEDDFDRQFGSFAITETSSGIDVRGANAWFTGLPEQMRLTDFTCQGVSTLSLVQTYFEMTDGRPIAQHKLGIFAQTDQPFMVVHDDPHCTVGIKPGNAGVDDAEVKVQLSSLYECGRGEGGRIACTDADGKTVTVVYHGEAPALVDGRTLIVRDAVDIRLAGGEDFEALDPYLEDEDFDGSAAITVRDGEVVAQTVALGDMEMTISGGGDEDSLKVRLDKATHVGSFVVLALDAALFEDCAVSIEGWDVTEGDKEALELRPATSLADALDASYDGDHVKYYAVEDAYGCQLILTNSHYSVKEFELQAATTGLSENIPGLEVALVPGLLVVVAVVRQRRRV